MKESIKVSFGLSGPPVPMLLL